MGKMPRFNHLFEYDARATRLRRQVYLAVAFLLAAVLWFAIIDSPERTGLDRPAFAFSIALASLSLAAALSIGHPAEPAEPDEPANAAPGRYATSESELLEDLRQELGLARKNKNVVALMIVDAVRGGDMPLWARAQQQNRIERILNAYNKADFRLYRLNDTQFGLVVTEAEAINKVLDIADLLQRPSGKNGPEERFSRAYLTFGIAADRGSRGSPEGLLHSANVALRRAQSLNTGRYIILEEVIPS